MAKSAYHIAYVEHGYEELWRKYWMTNDHSDEVLAAHAAGRLGRVDYLEANSLTDAMEQVRSKFPDCNVLSQGSGRLSGANR